MFNYILCVNCLFQSSFHSSKFAIRNCTLYQVSHHIPTSTKWIPSTLTFSFSLPSPWPMVQVYLTECEPPHMVPYLSPIILHKEVELLLSLDGPEALEREELLSDKPIIYWNLVWYFSRLSLPTYLPLLKLRAFLKNRPDLKKVK